MPFPSLGPTSPSLSQSALTRRDAANERRADAIHDILEWSTPNSKHLQPGFHMVRQEIKPGARTERVLFTGRFWMTDAPIAAWRPVAAADASLRPHRPIGNLAATSMSAAAFSASTGMRSSELIPTGITPSPTPKKALSLDDLELVPMDPAGQGLELESVAQLAQLEMKVEVVRFAKPAPNASGVSTGKIVAVSENYSAQQISAGKVVLHENKNLDRSLSAGDKVTMQYADGKASVCDGLLHDINISAPWMPKDQQAYIRMIMLDALGTMEAPEKDDARLKDALLYALESAANFYGVSESRLRRASIQLTVNDKQVANDAAAARGSTPSP